MARKKVGLSGNKFVFNLQIEKSSYMFLEKLLF